MTTILPWAFYCPPGHSRAIRRRPAKQKHVYAVTRPSGARTCRIRRTRFSIARDFLWWGPFSPRILQGTPAVGSVRLDPIVDRTSWFIRV